MSNAGDDVAVVDGDIYAAVDEKKMELEEDFVVVAAARDVVVAAAVDVGVAAAVDVLVA